MNNKVLNNVSDEENRPRAAYSDIDEIPEQCSVLEAGESISFLIEKKFSRVEIVKFAIDIANKNLLIRPKLTYQFPLLNVEIEARQSPFPNNQVMIMGCIEKALFIYPFYSPLEPL